MNSKIKFKTKLKKKSFLFQTQLINKKIKDYGGTTWRRRRILPAVEAYAANVAEDEVATAYDENPYVQKVKEFAAKENAEVVAISARVESEIAELDEEEAKAFLEDLGETESGLDRLIKAAFDLLGLQTFLTAGSDECRAWTIVKGTTAPKAAGKIHTDFERGFIRAEIVNYNDLVTNGSVAAAREKGLVRVEGKDYVMRDGDVVNFRFNV